MRLLIRAPKDFCIGLIYLAAGSAGLLIGRNYPFGSGARMGPGYFPMVVAGLLVLFGAIALIRSVTAEGEGIGGFAWKQIALVLGSAVAFGLLLETAGLVVALVALVLVGAAASENFRLEWMAVLGLLVLVTFCALVFVKGLGLPMPLVGSWFQTLAPAWLGG